jgi:TetR/AcrR family transcriptional regulator, mexJK operon transcriptional repressor
MSHENNKYGHDERRAAILETARKVFLEEGYFTTTMEDIAARHGGSKTTLYKYFPSKNDLFSAIVEAQSVEIQKQLNVFSGMASDIRTVLQCFCSRCLTIMLSKDMIAFDRIIIAEAHRIPETAGAAYEIGFKPALDYWEKIIQEAIDAGQLRKVDARIATAYLLELSSSPLKKLRLWGIPCDISPETIDYHADVIVSIFLAAFGNDALAHEARKFTGL